MAREIDVFEKLDEIGRKFSFYPGNSLGEPLDPAKPDVASLDEMTWVSCGARIAYFRRCPRGQICLHATIFVDNDTLFHLIVSDLDCAFGGKVPVHVRRVRTEKV